MKKILTLLMISLFFVSCSEKPAEDFSAEPADPDNPGIAVWEQVAPGIHSGFGSLDKAYSKSTPPEGRVAETMKLHGWKGERVSFKLLVWTAGNEEEVRIETGDLIYEDSRIQKEQISVSLVGYVLTDQFLNELGSACGPRDNDKVPVHIAPDPLIKNDRFILNAPVTRPVWVSVDIPAHAAAGIYHGAITRKSKSGSVEHPFTLEVQNKLLPPAAEWPFHLDLWQNPYAVARYHGVELWSEAHLDLLRPLLKKLADAGQKCITAIMIDTPWGTDKPCYDDHREMIRWIKKKDGTWEYDYSIFDKYVSLAMECGITQQITCYTMVPIDNTFSWYDEERSEVVVKELFSGTKEYEDHWRPFLADFRRHLKEKGWFEITTIGLDERGEEEMAKMFDFMDEVAPDFKIAVAGFYHGSINYRIYDFCSNWRDWGRIPVDSIPVRKDAGLVTTYYVACGIPEPNSFTFSPPAESCYLGWMASSMGFDGFLRWAYNSWPENPMVDSRYDKWPAGDTYYIYPGPLSSVRFERLREGIQDYEKIRILLEELERNTTPKGIAAKEKLLTFLSGVDASTIRERTADEVINEGKQLIYEIVNNMQ